MRRSKSLRRGATWAGLLVSGLAGVALGLSGYTFYFGEGFASIFFPDTIKYMPFAVARASINTGAQGGFGGGSGGVTQALDADTALLLVAAWLLGSMIMTVVFTERAEITGSQRGRTGSEAEPPIRLDTPVRGKSSERLPKEPLRCCPGEGIRRNGCFCHASRASITSAAPTTLTQPTHDLAAGAADPARTQCTP